MKYGLFVCICALLALTACRENSSNRIKRAAADRKITDLNYTNTEAQIITAWGPPDAYADYAGTNNFFRVYCVADHEEWIAFKTEPPHQIIVFLWMPPAANVIPERRTRKLSDLTITNGIMYEQVTAVWGRPDYFPPTGIEYYAYLLENGQEVWFEFDVTHPPYRSLGAIFFDPKKGTSKHLI